MIFSNRFGLCGLVLCCLLVVFNVQSAKGRLLLELGNAMQIREVSIPAERQIETVKGVVSAAEWLKHSVLHTGSRLAVGSTFLNNNLWKKGKSYQPSGKSEGRVCVASFDCSTHHKKESIDLNKHTEVLKSVSQSQKNEVPVLGQTQERLKMEVVDAEKLFLNPQLLPKGQTPPSGPNPGHNDLILAAEDVKLVKGKLLVTNSLPKGPTTPSAPNPKRNALTVNLLPKPPSSPNTKHNKPSDAKRDQMQFSKHTIVTQKPVNDDSTQKLSELVGCQQDIMPM